MIYTNCYCWCARVCSKDKKRRRREKNVSEVQYAFCLSKIFIIKSNDKTNVPVKIYLFDVSIM